MVVRQGDYQIPVEEMGSPAGDDMGQWTDNGMPTEADEAGLSQDGLVEGVDTQYDEPLEESDLRTQLIEEYETKFSQDKANIQRTFSEKEERLLGELSSAHEQSYATRQQLGKAHDWVREYIKSTGGDPRDAATFMVSIMGAERDAQRTTQAQRQELQGWLGRQQQGFQQEVQQRSVDPKTGQQLFDPGDPSLAEAFSTFVDVGRRHHAAGQGSQLSGQYHQAWETYQTMLTERERDGYRATGSEAPSGQSQPGAPATPAENRAKGVARGPQNRLAGGAAGVTNDTILADARSQYPGEDQDARLKRQAYFVQQRREHKIEG